MAILPQLQQLAKLKINLTPLHTLNPTRTPILMMKSQRKRHLNHKN
jgi:hypothetical protein